MAYYDIFTYPLTAEEVYHNLITNHTNLDEVTKELYKLSDQKIVYKKENFFLLKDNDSYITRRLNGNKLAGKRLNTAKRISGFISRFPFTVHTSVTISREKHPYKRDSIAASSVRYSREYLLVPICEERSAPGRG